MTLKRWRLTQKVRTKDGGHRTMTQADAARHFGVDRGQYGHWEAGRRFPDDASWSIVIGPAIFGLGLDDARLERLRKAQRKVFEARHAISARKGR